MASLQTIATAQAYAVALQQLTGQKPVIIYTDNKAILQYTNEQKIIVRKWLRAELDKKKSPDGVEIEFSSIIFPVLLQKYFPYILLIVGAGFAFNKITR